MIEEIVVNNKKFTISTFHGEVVNQQVSSTSYSSSGIGRDTYGNLISTFDSGTLTTKEFFLVNQHGEERAYSFTGQPIPSIRPGHIGQVIYVKKEGAKEFCLVLVRNATLNTDYLREKEIEQLCLSKASVVPELASMLVALFCVFFSIWQLISFLILDGGFISLILVIIAIPIAVFLSKRSNAKFANEQKLLKVAILNRRI